MRLVAGIVSGLVIVLLSGLGIVFALSESHLHDVAPREPFEHPIPTDAASIERGRYIARTRGCFGCHGQKLQGMDFDEQWDWPARAVAPNLVSFAREHDAATIAAAIRQGIGARGEGLVSMPSYNFTRLSDADTAALIAFLGSAPLVELDLPSPRLGWIARLDLALGRETTYAHWARQVPQVRIDPALEPERARGEYLAMTMCNECHGLDLRGYSFNGEVAPDLAIVGAIARDEFERIVRTGRGLGERHLGLMTLVAPDRYRTLTDDDIEALYRHLSSLLGVSPSQAVFWRQ
jgi:mono/diheme cytochrome c family protein